MTRQDITLRITLGDMPVDDSFWVAISLDTSRNVHHLIDSVFPDSAESAEEIQKSLDTRANPDLPEMHQAIQEIIRQWKDGLALVEFKSTSGADVLLADKMSRHMTTSTENGNSIQLILEQRLDALTAYQRTDRNLDDFVQWMQGCSLIYFMDKHHYALPTEPDEQTHDWLLLPIADELETLSFVAPSRTEDAYEITRQGRGFLGNLIAETESYIRRFDVFSDILPGRGLQPTVFDSGRGLDLRVQIFEAQGIDPFRAVFLLRIYDGTLDGHKDSWQTDILEPEFFNKLLEPVLDHDTVDDDDLDWVIDQGMEHTQKTADDASGAKRSRLLRPRRPTDQR